MEKGKGGVTLKKKECKDHFSSLLMLLCQSSQSVTSLFILSWYCCTSSAVIHFRHLSCPVNVFKWVYKKPSVPLVLPPYYFQWTMKSTCWNVFPVFGEQIWLHNPIVTYLEVRFIELSGTYFWTDRYRVIVQGCNPVCFFLGVSYIEHNGTDFRGSMHRIVLLGGKCSLQHCLTYKHWTPYPQ